MFKDLFWPFAALLIALVPTVLVLAWLFMPGYRDLVRRMFSGFGAILPLPSFRMPFALLYGVAFWMVAMLLLARRSWADAVLPAPVTVDFTPLVAQLLPYAVAAFAAVIAWALHRIASVMEKNHLLDAGDVHDAKIDGLADSLAQWSAAQLEAVADPLLKTQLKNTVVAQAAQMLIAQAPKAIAATGITPAGVEAAIKLKLDPPNAATAVSS